MTLIPLLGRRSRLGARVLGLLAERADSPARSYVALVTALADPSLPSRDAVPKALALAGLDPDEAVLCDAAADVRSALTAADLASQAAAGRDVLGEILEDVTPAAERRRLGQHFTPAWLADHVLERSGLDASSPPAVLDPSCGSGVFLLRIVRRVYAACGDSEPVRRRLLETLAGCDVDPLALAAARVNLRLALRLTPDVDPPVRQEDVLAVSPPALDGRQFPLVVGNPPWVRWNLLDEATRRRTVALWHAYGLFSLSGMQALLGGGEKDLAMLFVYRVADRHLCDGGRLAMVVPQVLFKAKGAGEGFRRFRLGELGAPLGVDCVDDLSLLKPFRGASNKTAVLTLVKGRETRYPVRYVVWRKAGEGTGPSSSLEEVRAATRREEQAARPLGPGATTAWRTSPESARSPLFALLDGPGPYRARRGASADPYGVYLVDVLETCADGAVRVRNRATDGKRAVEETVCRLEPDLLFPALRGADIRAWACRPACYLLLPQDPRTRKAYPEAWLRERLPLTHAYFERHRVRLAQRRSRPVQALAAGSAFYATIGVGPYTFAPYRVVWGRMANDLAACVVDEVDTPMGRRPAVGIDTTSYVPLDAEPEAHYLCALLNSVLVRDYVRSFSSAGRGFGAPRILERLAVPRFRAGDALHRQLAELGRRAAQAGGCEDYEELVAEVVVRDKERHLSAPVWDESGQMQIPGFRLEP